MRRIKFHVPHPSVVLYNRLLSPGPLASTTALIAFQACTPRKSRVAPSLAASGVAHCVQCAPPSRVFSTVPPVPLAQATVPSTESIPRRPAVVPESCICQIGGAAGGLDWAKASAEAAINGRSEIARMGGSITLRAEVWGSWPPISQRTRIGLGTETICKKQAESNRRAFDSVCREFLAFTASLRGAILSWATYPRAPLRSALGYFRHTPLGCVFLALQLGNVFLAFPMGCVILAFLLGLELIRKLGIFSFWFQACLN